MARHIGTNNLHIEGNGTPTIIAEYSSKGVTLTVETTGSSQDSSSQNMISDINNQRFCLNQTTDAKITFHYNSKLGDCVIKADSIKVNSFSQTLGDAKVK